MDIQTYGISITTLEQVFLEIGHDPNPQPKVASLVKKSELNVLGHRNNEAAPPKINGSDANKDHDNQLLKGPFNPKGLEFEGGDVEFELALRHLAKEQTSAKKKNSLDSLDSGEESDLNFSAEQIKSDARTIHAGKLKNKKPSEQRVEEELSRNESHDELSFSQLMEGGEYTEKPLGKNLNEPQDLEKNVKSSPPQEAAFQKFSLAESKLDKSCCNNFKAVFIKRVNSYR